MMKWKRLVQPLVRTVSQPDHALLLELASAALLLAWVARWSAE